MILTSFFAALSQMTDPRFRRVLITGVGLTILLLIGMSALFIWFVGGMIGDSVSLPFVGEVTWLDEVLTGGSVIAVLALSAILMVPVASAITSMFLDTVAQAVEDAHYPHLGPAKSVPITDALIDTISFLGVLIIANIVALVLYLIFLPLGPVIFWALNGFLLGREYFTLAAMRRVGRSEAKVLRKRYSLRIWIAGFLMAIPLSVPLLNLVIPILGAATFTHLFHRLVPQGPSGQTSRDRGH